MFYDINSMERPDFSRDPRVKGYVRGDEPPRERARKYAELLMNTPGKEPVLGGEVGRTHKTVVFFFVSTTQYGTKKKNDAHSSTSCSAPGCAHTRTVSVHVRRALFEKPEYTACNQHLLREQE